MFLGIRNNIFWLLVLTITVGMVGLASGQAIQGTDSGLGGQNSITGMVLTPTGQRMQRRVAIKLTTMTSGDRIAFTDEVGNFAFRGLPNGDYSLIVDKEKEYEPFVQNVNVFQMRGTPGQNFMVSIRLKAKAGSSVKPGVMNAELAGVPPKAIELFNKAGELAKTGNHKEAIEKLQKAIVEYPAFMLAINEMGVQHLRLDEPVKADEAFQAALKINPEAYAPLMNHGMTLFQLKKYSEAETVLLQVVKSNENSAVAHYFLGQALANQGKFVKAEKELTTAINTGGPEFKEAHRLLAIIYSSSGDKLRAAAELETYLKLAPKAPDADQLRKVIEEFKASANQKSP